MASQVQGHIVVRGLVDADVGHRDVGVIEPGSAVSEPE
jgi:hypothetical protein